MALSSGNVLFNGHYRIIRQLGRGGFGFVYLAQDTLLDEQVAIKELIPALVGDETVLKRFLVEAKATMRLTHEHIVRTHNVFAEGGNYYIAMEYMSGGSLEERLRERGPLPVDEAVRIAAEVCEGLDYAHHRGVVHCDLKPANILFANQGAAKVADFGIAHVSGEVLTRSWQTPAGFVAGTLPYMSPEQADGVREDARVDIYALGAVLYRMLTGRTYLDFDSRETPGATADNVYRIRNQEPEPPSIHRQHVLAWLDRVVLKTLAKGPEDRYSTASELRTALLQQRPAAGPVAQPEPVETVVVPSRPTPLVPPARATRTPRPPWFWPMVGVAGAVLLAVVIALAFVLGDQEHKAGTVAPQAAETRIAAETATLQPRPISSPAIAVLQTRPVQTATPLLPVDTLVPPVPSQSPALTPSSTSTDSPTPLAPTAAPTDTPPPSVSPPGGTLPPSTLPSFPPANASCGDRWVCPGDGMTMIYVPGGEFRMGSEAGEGDERPVHRVRVDGFWVDQFEITNAAFERFVQQSGYRTDAEKAGRGDVWQNRQWNPVAGVDWRHPNSPDDSIATKMKHPVVQVSWLDASAYCQWAGARLPAEAEWEFAALGTTGWRYPWGNEYDINRLNAAGNGTVAVGRFESGKSPCGAYDMAGNVWEWVNDWYQSDYYASSPVDNPRGPATGVERVLRGGAWDPTGGDSRSADRGALAPDSRGNTVGFRCARTP